MRGRTDKKILLKIENLIIISLILILSSCKKSENIAETNQLPNTIICTNEGCKGFYEGPEFINGDDVAHQFSNTMSAKVGEKLKEFYQSKTFRKVDFLNIKMSTVGMKSGNVKYELSIPFVKVENECDAFTSFDHVGGWNHIPALEERKNQLKNLLKEGQNLNTSELKTTPEGLQEYWIQWKNKDLQKNCE